MAFLVWSLLDGIEALILIRQTVQCPHPNPLPPGEGTFVLSPLSDLNRDREFFGSRYG